MTSGLFAIVWAVVLPLTNAPERKSLVDTPRSIVRDAVANSLGVESGSIDLRHYREMIPKGCVISSAYVSEPVQNSGRLVIRLKGDSVSGQHCLGIAQLEAWVERPVIVVTRLIKEGESFNSNVRQEKRWVVPSIQYRKDLRESDQASRTISPETLLEERHIKVAQPARGENINVKMKVGGLIVETKGTWISMKDKSATARLSSGKTVVGEWDGHSFWLGGL